MSVSQNKLFKSIVGCISFCFLLCCSLQSFGNHVKGGYIRYEYAGVGSTAGTSAYKVTVTIFYGCGVQGPRSPITLRALNAGTGASVLSVSLQTTTSATVTKKIYSPCMNNPPSICYEVYTYVTTITLTDNTGGYILAVTDNFRTANIINITNSGAAGIAFTAQISGVINNIDYHTNTSPVFDFKDTAIVCYKGSFSYQFSASDPVDKDSLSYSFGNGLNYTTSSTAPFYAPLTYTTGYNGNSPMGTGVTIDPKTGLISGSAPTTLGEYVIAVYVSEWRDGVLIDAIKKELQVYVYDCNLTAAALAPSYTNCDNYTFAFSNESTAAGITSYSWDFGVAGINTDVSTQPTPTYTYTDTGSYTVKLKVGNGAGCEDSTTSIVKVYPGFNTDFTVSGSCYQSSFSFTDATYIKYGKINSYVWDFGDVNTTSDVSTLKNPTYQYNAAGSVTVTLITSSDKGCIDTASKTVIINNKPTIILPFTDTLICSIDSLPIPVQSNGTSFSWSPAYNIINSNTANPIVYPKNTTVYTVTVYEKGCVDSAKVKVNVLDFVTVKIASDTAMCTTDSITLAPISDALKYSWTESPGSNTLSSYSVKYPKASPSVATTYYVTANLGYCQDSAKINVHVSPYPTVSVSADTAICYGSRAQLMGITNAPLYSWSPVSSLYLSTTLHPIAGPVQTTAYVLSVRDTAYCTKNVIDTVIVKVIQPLKLSAGNDTTIVVNQSLQLNATYQSSYTYTWSPSISMNNTAIYNPVVTFNNTAIDSVTYIVTATSPEGCISSDNITVKIFNTQADIFAPTAFTPNADGKNDLLKPILVGISKLDYFRIYNRWGQIVFYTSESDKGWDGKISGVPQSSGTFVFTAQGTDYTGKTLIRKGTVVLIR